MKILLWLQSRVDKITHDLFLLMTEEHAYAHVTRFAITFLDIWQAIIILNHNYWIPQLVDTGAPVYYYTIFSVVLSIFAIVALLIPRILWFSAFVLVVNALFYLLLGIAGLWYSNPPRASSGFSLFVTLICISAFWRIMLLIIRDRVIRKR